MEICVNNEIKWCWLVKSKVKKKKKKQKQKQKQKQKKEKKEENDDKARLVKVQSTHQSGFNFQNIHNCV